jgi:hypothetical protein
MSKKSKQEEPKPELQVIYDDAPPRLYVIRHLPTGTWWGADRAGYTGQLTRAGTYTQQALKTCNLREGEDEVVELSVATRDFVSGANPTVLQAMLALGSR